jgi:hypothetical protein
MEWIPKTQPASFVTCVLLPRTVTIFHVSVLGSTPIRLSLFSQSLPFVFSFLTNTDLRQFTKSEHHHFLVDISMPKILPLPTISERDLSGATDSQFRQ